ncbi:MAG: hypothetical protein LH477_09490 [Nocardioides sp.]|nr:hypothetical protein [Nocardioides sp.]
MTTDDTPRLPGLSAADTRWLVAEAQRVLADLGETSTVLEGVALTLADQRVMGLDNLARAVSRLPRKRWARAVRDQLTALVHVRPDTTPAIEDLRVKLWPAERADDLTYEPLEPLPGVVAVLAAQGNGVSLEFSKLDLVGERDEAYQAALTNVAGLPRPRHTRRRIDPHSRNSWVDFLDSGDAYGAARVVVLPDLMRKLRIDFPPHGVLVAVPTKFELWVHVPVHEDVVQTALTMSWLAHQTWVEEPYPVSPDVFLVSPDMDAVRLVRPDHHGCEVDERTMLGLVRAMALPDGGARRAS